MQREYGGNTNVVRLALTVLAFSGVACGSHAGHASQVGVARVVARCLASDSAIARVTVTVSKGGGSDFTPIAADLTKSGDQWIGRITGIPAGSLRMFDAVAYDASGSSLYTGSGQSDIVSGAAAVVSITLEKAAPPVTENSFPVIDSLAWSKDRVGPGGTVQVVASAHDPDAGDTLSYLWQGDCGSFDSATSTAAVWTAPAAEEVCHLSFTVTDNHGAAVSVAFSIDVSTTATGDADVTVTLNSWPVITSLTGTVRIGTTMEGDLTVAAVDPDGDSLAYTWSSDCSGILFNVSTPYADTTPHFSLPLPATSCQVKVTVSDGKVTGGTIAIVHLPPGTYSTLCQGVTCQVGQVCDPTTGACKASDLCAGVTCTASDACHVAGTCNSATGSCSAETAKVCSTGESCDLTTGQCAAACTPACTGKACGTDGCGGSCGTCATGTSCDTTGQCAAACTPACSGKVCGTDGCGGSCGTCATGTSCDTTGQCVAACTPACSGKVCGTDGCGGSCGTCATGTSCDATGQCAAACTPACSGKVCGTDGCGGSCGTCATGESCSADGLCQTPVTVPTPQIARDLLIMPPAGLAMDPAGGTYVVASIYSEGTVIDFDGHPVTGTGDADLFVAKYSAATGLASWAFGFGDAANGQYGTGAAVTNNGKLAVLGNFTGTFKIGSASLSSASLVDFLALLDAGTGTGTWAKAFNDGENGSLAAVAANPGDATAAHGNRIAVCGFASAAATDLVAGATTDGQLDIIIAVYDASGSGAPTLLWSKQIGTASNEECDSLAVDDNGDVIAAGKFDGASLSFGGSTAALTGPGSGLRKFMWVAKFGGATGVATAAAAFSGPGGNVTPKALAVDASGNAFVGGNFTGSPTLGTTFTSAGSADAFVAKLDTATRFTPAWAVRLGGTSSDTVNAAAVTSAGDVVVTGSFLKTTTGAAALTATGTTAPDVFLLQLDGTTGATTFATAYGATGTQSGDALVVNRFGGDQLALTGTLNNSITFPSPAGTVKATNATDTFLLFGGLK